MDNRLEVGKRPLPPTPQLVATMRQRVNRCRALGYTSVNVATDHLTQILDIAEKAAKP